MVQRIDLIEENDQRELGLVEDGETVEHVAHEGVRVLAPDSVGHVQAHGWERAAQALGDDLATRGLREGLDLSWSVDDDVAIEERLGCLKSP